VNFEEKARLLSEHASVCMVPDASTSVATAPASIECVAVPAAWNRFTDASWSRHRAIASTGSAASAEPAPSSPSSPSSSSVASRIGLSGDGADGSVVGGGVAGAAVGATAATTSARRLRLFFDLEGSADIGSEEYINDRRKVGRAVLMSRRSIRQSARVQNWAQAIVAAQEAGAAAVVVFNNLDAMEPFRMGLFGELAPSIPAFMVSGADGAALSVAGALGCDVLLGGRSAVEAARLSLQGGSGAGSESIGGSSSSRSSGVGEDLGSAPPPWPLTGARLPADVAQAWSLLEAMSSHEEEAQAELQALLNRMTVPEKRVWLTRRLVRHHRSQQDPDGGFSELPLAFVEGDRSLSPAEQIAAIRQQLVEGIGLGSEDLCGEFEVRFKDEHGVGSAVLREWIDLAAGEAFLHPSNRLLRSYDRRQTFWPDPAAPFCNPQWQLDYEALGRLLGLALWQSCTLDLPLHPRVCALLLGFPRLEGGEEAAASDSVFSAEKAVALEEFDEELYRTKVKWLLANPVAELGFDMPFTDPLGRTDEQPPSPSQDRSVASGSRSVEATGSSASSSSSSSTCSSSAAQPEPLTEAASSSSSVATAAEVAAVPFGAVLSLPAVVRLSDRLPGTERSFPGKVLLQVGTSEVALDGADGELQVTDDNKLEFVNALTEWRTHGGIELQVQAMAKGLRTVVPEAVLTELRGLLQPAEVAQLLSGMGEICVDDWERHTAYTHGLYHEGDLVTWFWRTVREWASSPEEQVRLQQLLQFVTGSARVPVGGFAELVGFNGAKHPFTLSKGTHLTPQSLPMAHACICTLDLPPYEDFETCRAKLTQMLAFGRSHFDEAAGRRGEDTTE